MYSSVIKGNCVKIYIGGIMHLCYPQGSLMGIQTYIKNVKWYCIDIYLINNTTILCEYDESEKWTEIIKLLDDSIK